LPAFILSDGTFARPAALQGRTAGVGSQPYIVETVMTLSLLIALLAGAPSSESILAAADAFDRVQLAQDEKGMERMILDSFIFIDGSGKRQGKHAFIAGWLTPGDKYDPITLIDRTVTPLGDEAAVVSAETSLCGTSDGARFCRRMRFSDTFVRVDGDWRVAHVQVTRMPAD
jgi:ketosteroid isomerase-like protein